VLGDGRSWRYEVFPNYKASRDKPPETKQEIEQATIRASVKSQKRLLIEALKLLGVRRMSTLNLEADDLAAMLVRRYAATKSILLLSGDKDWIQLVRPNVTWLDLINKRRISVASFSARSPAGESVGIGFVRDEGKPTEQWVSLARPDQWLDVKCLMGDKSDEIEGVGGIGEKGAIELVREYGSVDNFVMQTIDHSIDVGKLPKKFRDFAQSDAKQDIFKRNQMLMNLDSARIPASNGARMVHAPFDDSGFRTFCETWMFQSILKDFDNWTTPFKGEAHAEA